MRKSMVDTMMNNMKKMKITLPIKALIQIYIKHRCAQISSQKVSAHTEATACLLTAKKNCVKSKKLSIATNISIRTLQLSTIIEESHLNIIQN